MRVLDLFCGAGGAAMGIHRALPDAEIIGVDIKPQKHYPFTFVQADAMRPPFDLKEFDFIWASPPCQAYMDTNGNGRKASRHPRLIEPTRQRLFQSGKPYVIENVHKAPLDANLMLCGTMFGLRVIRHRYFECSVPMPLTVPCYHWGQVANGEFSGVYARKGKGHRHGRGKRDAAPEPAQASPSEAMGIDWMDWDELRQAVPPAYSEFITRQIFPGEVTR